jgi:carbonic anhydrase/acetyltransferase-like protein (isoleucine patch superfamily)
MIYRIESHAPTTATDSWFIAPSADVIGRVHLGHEASIWFQCVLRGDSDWIRIGDGSNIQDGSIIHTDEGFPTHVGARVTLGHRAFLHSCTIGDDTMIANGAMVLDRVTIGRHCLIAAGALIPPDKQIPDGVVVMGAPGKIVREVTEADRARIAHAGEVYRLRAAQYRATLARDARVGTRNAPE